MFGKVLTEIGAASVALVRPVSALRIDATLLPPYIDPKRSFSILAPPFVVSRCSEPLEDHTPWCPWRPSSLRFLSVSWTPFPTSTAQHCAHLHIHLFV